MNASFGKSIIATIMLLNHSKKTQSKTISNPCAMRIRRAEPHVLCLLSKATNRSGLIARARLLCTKMRPAQLYYNGALFGVFQPFSRWTTENAS